MRQIEKQDFIFKTKPYEHQREAFERGRDQHAFGYLMDMGTGKTKVTIDDAAYNYAKGRCNFVLIAAPNDVHRNWIDREIPKHLPDWVEHRTCTWSANMLKADWEDYWALWDDEFKGLRIMAVNFEAFSASPKFWDRASPNPEKPKFGPALKSIVNAFDVFWIVDESSKIKTPGARRTKRIINMADKTAVRRILTGTLGGPLDAWAQFMFLDPTFLGIRSFFSYKHRYAEWETERNWSTGRNYEVLKGYKNLKELQQKIDDHSFRVRKVDCLDLPLKTYRLRLVDMTKEQKSVYGLLKESSIMDLRAALNDPDAVMRADNVLVKYLRLQQIIGGWVPESEEENAPVRPIHGDDPMKNPRIKAMTEVIEEAGEQKVIIWARFRAEIEAITETLNKIYGKGKAAAFYGGTDKKDRKDIIDGFQEGDIQFFVGNPHSGGYGLTLTAATVVVYYSNDFSLEARLQSEDRAHRIGQEHPVTYVDLVARDTIDTRIMKSLLQKRKLADTVVGDEPAEWFKPVEEEQLVNLVEHAMADALAIAGMTPGDRVE